jgi:UDP-MurNAc hydroxylase
MQITFLGHAGFLVETTHAIVVMDPWLSPAGAFDSGWFQFPCNHHLAPWVREKLQDTQKDRYIYISHEHRDHFDTDFLTSLPDSGFQFIVPHFHRAALRTELTKKHSARVISCRHRQQIDIQGGSLRLYLDDSGVNRDSCILMKADGQSFLNMNDCKLHDELPAIVRDEGPVSAFACQFSGATYHPTCYDYPRDEYERISRHKRDSKFQMVQRAIETTSARVYLPSAGPACFLDPELLEINFEPCNIFPRASQLIRHLRENLPASPLLVPEMMPGDVLHVEENRVEFKAEQRIDEENFESYVRSYAARYRNYFSDRQPRVSPREMDRIIERLRIELQNKLAALTLHDRIDVPLFFALSDYDGKVLRIDFPKRRVDEAPSIDASGNYYSVKAPSWQIARVLDGLTTWEEFALTFRMRLNRKPDVYQTLIQGFLLMEPEDMNWFCGRLLEIEQRRNRAIIDAGGTRYSIDRLCPHQGADLTQGCLQDGRLWTCPRHRWQFALDKDGQCTTNDATINAVCLEGD